MSSKNFIYAICILTVVPLITVGGFFKKFTSTDCSSQTHKFLSLLNLMCNTTQTTSIANRDACYGCFFRAGNLPAGTTQLTSLSQCATMYLANTNFSTCANDLAMVVNGNRPTSPPTSSFCFTGYCDFVRCIRRVNSNNLVSTCFVQNAANRNFNQQTDQIYFYTNMTNCILARTRCAVYNPISGQLQNDIGIFGSGTVQQALTYNALQITASGDIRILSFPATTGIGELFCSRVTSLSQSTYMEAVC